MLLILGAWEAEMGWFEASVGKKLERSHFKQQLGTIVHT
jgi:hypothetical protein